jgi:long-chain fatty acid transport protein
MRTSSFALTVCALCISQSLHAEGYKLYEQSVSAMGNAYAGRGAQISDATLVYSNPAALTELTRAQLSTGATFIHATTDYQVQSAKSAAGQAVIGRTQGKNSLNEVVPFLFYSDRLDHQWSYGFGFYVPFGLSSDYADDWAGRYFADETAIEVLALQGSVGYRLNDQWSIGGGLSVNHVTGELSKFKDHSGLCETGRNINGVYGADVFNEAYCNSHYLVSGDDVKLAYNLAVHGRFTTGTQVGLIYHSEIDFTLHGNSEITNTPITGANVAGSPNFIVVAPNLPAINKVTGKLAHNPFALEKSAVALTTPADLTFSIDQRLNSDWSMQASVSWTGWSAFKSIDIVSRDPNPSMSLSTQQPQNLNQPGYIGYIPEYWRDTLAGALGATWQITAERQFKTGIAYDENPISASHRTARVPTKDRVWLTFGWHEQINNRLNMDMAFGYLWMSNLTSNEAEYNVQDKRINLATLQASYSNHALLAGVQVNYLF